MDFNIPDNQAPAILAIIVACLLPIVLSGIAKITSNFTWNDNANPRQFAKSLQGFPSRVIAAEQNSYESLPMFLSAVILAMLFFVPQTLVNYLAILYVSLRILYSVAYMLNLAIFRSILWVLSIACSLMLFYITLQIIV